MSAINTNVSALFAQNALKINARNMTTAMEQLSTGRRINSAKDDAAGLAIGQSMTSQIRGLNQAVRNANDGVNMLQTAEGAMVEQTNMLQRMRELAVQAANGTYSSTQRSYLQTEFSELGSQIDDISTDTTWNGIDLLTSATFSFQVGQSSGQTIDVVIGDMSLTTLAASMTTPSSAISSATSAQTTLGYLDSALDIINAQRATIGAGINRLTYAADNLSNISANVEASRSTVWIQTMRRHRRSCPRPRSSSRQLPPCWRRPTSNRRRCWHCSSKRHPGAASVYLYRGSASDQARWQPPAGFFASGWAWPGCTGPPLPRPAANTGHHAANLPLPSEKGWQKRQKSMARALLTTLLSGAVV